MYRVLLAVDEDEARTRRAAEAVAALPRGTDGLDVVVLNVFEAFDVMDGEGGRVRSDDVYDETDFPQSVSVAVDVLETAGVETEVRREHGEPAEVIVDLAREIEADAIALAGRGRSPAGKAIFGSVTQSVLLSADRPVIVTTVK